MMLCIDISILELLYTKSVRLLTNIDTPVSKIEMKKNYEFIISTTQLINKIMWPFLGLQTA